MSPGKQLVAIISGNPKIHWTYVQYHTDPNCPFCLKIRPEFRDEIPLNYAKIKYKHCKICKARSTKRYQTYPQTRMMNLLRDIDKLIVSEEPYDSIVCDIQEISKAKEGGLKI